MAGLFYSRLGEFPQFAVGRIADDPRYPFPIYADLVELEATEIWRPEAEILAARSQ